MASDLVVALARATQDGHTFFGHNCNRPRGDSPSLHLIGGREAALGDTVQLSHVRIPEARRTWTILGGRAGREPGLQHGVNEKGVAAGCTPIATRLRDGEPGLTGSELVQLALERACSARQAVDVLTDLIGRHGQAKGDSAFLVADHREAYLLEAAGRHWVLALVGQVRAVSGVCLLRQDWDRISRGLSDLAITRGWWPEDGCKLDFAGTLGEPGPDHLLALRRWGQATLRLEQHSGQIDAGFLRQLLGDLAEAVCPVDTQAAVEEQTSASLLVRLGPRENDMPVAWYAFGSPGASVYLPVFPVPGLPAAFTDDYGLGSRLWRQLQQWQADCRHDPHVRAALHTALAGLQQRLDEHLHEFLIDAAELQRKGQTDALPRLAGSFMQHCCDRFDDLAGGLRGHGPEGNLKRPHSEELVGAAF